MVFYVVNDKYRVFLNLFLRYFSQWILWCYKSDIGLLSLHTYTINLIYIFVIDFYVRYFIFYKDMLPPPELHEIERIQDSQTSTNTEQFPYFQSLPIFHLSKNVPENLFLNPCLPMILYANLKNFGYFTLEITVFLVLSFVFSLVGSGWGSVKKKKKKADVTNLCAPIRILQHQN